MLPTRRLLGVLFATSLFLVAACEGPPTGPSGPSASPDGAPLSSARQAAPAGQGVDQHAIGQQIPAFGGFFLDDGVPVALLTDRSRRDGVARAVSHFLEARGLSPSDVEARKARFSYRELERFYGRAAPAVFAGPGGAFADLDEAHNRVTLGVTDEAARGRVRAEVAGLGLPDGAVQVVITEPIVPVQSLRDRFDPVPGGVQIHFSNYLCSIGVIAESGGQRGFVTASHCTDSQGGVEGTQYYQPTSSVDGTVIAVESKDPDYFSWRQGPCYRGSKCRYSDASFAASTGARPFALGEIAQTDGSGSLTWNGSYWNITGVGEDCGVVGDSRAKVGRTTGYTTGTVTQSCIDVGVSGSNIVLLDQDMVEGSGTIVGSGDSGSQVFQVSSGSDVTWWGALWGGSSDGSTLVYSPASNVERELGTLAVTGGSGGGGGGGGGGSATVSASFDYSCHFGDCDFDASASTGADTYSWDFGDNTSGSGVTTSHTYGGDGSYTVTLTATASDGTTTDETSQTIACQTKGPHLQCK